MRGLTPSRFAMVSALLLTSGCAHMATPQALPQDDPEVLRQEILAAEDLASQLSLYRASHPGACLDQARTTAEQLNQGARQYFLMTNYDHPTIKATAFILGRANVRRASEAARDCPGAMTSTSKSG